MKKGKLFLFLLVGLFAFSITQVQAADGASISIKYATDGVEGDEMYMGSASVGDQLSHKPTVEDEFVFWTLNGAVRRDLTENISLKVSSKMHLVAHYVSAGKHAVVFVDSNMQLLEANYVAVGEALNIPTPPTKPQSEFLGYVLFSQYETGTPEKTPANPGVTTFFVAKYEMETPTEKTVVAVNAFVTEGPYYANDVVTFTTTLEGFTHYEDEKGQVVSINPEYKVTIFDDMTITAVAGDPVEGPVVNIRGPLSLREGYVSYVGQFELETGQELVEHGFIYHDDTQDVYAQSNVYNAETNEFLMSFTAEGKDDFRAYVKYLDGGELKEEVTLIETLPTILEVRALSEGTETEFVGVVTGFTDYSEQHSNFDKVFIEDSTAAIVVYRAGFPQDLKVGDRYKVTGKLDSYSGLIQIASGATVEKLESDIELIAPVEVTDLTEIDESYQGKRVDLEGTVVSVSSTGQSLVVKVGENQITVRSNSNSADHTVNSHLLTATVGQVVKLHGIHVDWYNGSQLIPTLVEQVEFVMPSDEELAQLVLDAIVNEWENKSFNMGTDATLPQTGDYDSTITWTFASEGVIVEGKWNDVTADTTYAVTVVVAIDDVEVSEVFNITVKFVDEGQEGNTFIETFGQVAGGKSSYTTEETYVSTDNGFTWSMKGRNDQTLDGKAWALGNAGDGSFVQVVATGGIKSFSLDVVRAFGNSNARTLELFVNDVSYGTFSVSTSSDDKQVWEVDNINVLGNVTIKVISINTGSRGATIIDNFTWSEYVDVVEPPVQHIVTFDSDGGSDVPAQTINEGSKATRPANPIKAGFTFLGWFEEGAEEEFDFDAPITSNILLIASWVEEDNVFLVTFKDSDTVLATENVISGGFATKPEDPTKAGFEFLGWFTAEIDGVQFDFSTKIDSEISLYAFWSEITTLIFVSDFSKVGNSTNINNDVFEGNENFFELSQVSGSASEGPKYFTSGNAARFYGNTNGGNSLIIKTKPEYKIVSIELLFPSSGQTAGLISAKSGTVNFINGISATHSSITNTMKFEYSEFVGVELTEFIIENATSGTTQFRLEGIIVEVAPN